MSVDIERLTVRIEVKRMWLLKTAAYVGFFAQQFFNWAVKHSFSLRTISR